MCVCFQLLWPTSPVSSLSCTGGRTLTSWGSSLSSPLCGVWPMRSGKLKPIVSQNLFGLPHKWLARSAYLTYFVPTLGLLFPLMLLADWSVVNQAESKVVGGARGPQWRHFLNVDVRDVTWCTTWDVSRINRIRFACPSGAWQFLTMLG